MSQKNGETVLLLALPAVGQSEPSKDPEQAVEAVILPVLPAPRYLLSIASLKRPYIESQTLLIYIHVNN